MKSNTTAANKELSGVIQINEGQIQDHLGRIVRGAVEDTLNAMLQAEADELCGARRYERAQGRASTRAGHYSRKLHTTAGQVDLKIPKLRTLPFETAIIERYRRRQSSVEEALVEMYLAGVSVRRVEDITEALWGTRVSPSTVSQLNQQIYERIEAWRNEPLAGEFPYVFLDGIWLKRSWGGAVENVSVLVAVGVDAEGFRQVLGVCEGAREDKESWMNFLRHLKQRGLSGVRLFISDKCLGLVDSLADFYPQAQWQRCVVHFYRNVFTAVPHGKRKEVALLLKTIHAQEDAAAACEKALAIAAKLEAMKLVKAAAVVRQGAPETICYYNFPSEHWRSLRTNNPLERINKEIRRRTRVVGSFPDGHSALMLVAARLRHIQGTRWGTRRYLDMGRLRDMSRTRRRAEGTPGSFASGELKRGRRLGGWESSGLRPSSPIPPSNSNTNPCIRSLHPTNKCANNSGHYRHAKTTMCDTCRCPCGLRGFFEFRSMTASDRWQCL